jgi:hypothetical protein
MRDKILGTLIALAVATAGCQQTDTLSPNPETSPVDHLVLVSKDSITIGGHNGIDVGADARQIYTAIQNLKSGKGVSYVNVVSNISTDLSQLGDRIPLYQYILLDEKIGTDSGVQITFEAGRVKSIYLNSGKLLSQWPAGVVGDAPVRVGDQAETLAMKFARIRNSPKYVKKFERIMLLTKDLSTDFDPAMAGTPQWYFRYGASPDVYEDVTINFISGKVSSIEVRLYKEL